MQEQVYPYERLKAGKKVVAGSNVHLNAELEREAKQ